MNLDNIRISANVDFWVNDWRVSEEQAKEFVHSRTWWHVRDGYWASADAVLQVETIVSKVSVAALIWIITL